MMEDFMRDLKFVRFFEKFFRKEFKGFPFDEVLVSLRYDFCVLSGCTSLSTNYDSWKANGIHSDGTAFAANIYMTVMQWWILG